MYIALLPLQTLLEFALILRDEVLDIQGREPEIVLRQLPLYFFPINLVNVKLRASPRNESLKVSVPGGSKQLQSVIQIVIRYATCAAA